METIKVTVPSTVYHCSQIITGFLILRDQGWDVELEDRSRDSGNPFFNLPIVTAQYRGKKLIYDLSQTYPDLKERVFGAMQRLPLPEWEPKGRYKRPKDQN